MTRALSVLLALVLVFSCASVSSQELVEPTAAQVQLSAQAYEAFVDEDWERAIRLYQALLDLGPLNTAYASLGYALFKAGRCEEARAALDLAATAPKVVDPPPEAVDQALAAYREKLRESCPGFLILECRPRQTQVSIDGSALAPCPTEPVELARGDHVLIAAAGDASIERQVYVEAMETVTVALVIEGVEDEAVVGTLPPDGGAGETGGGSGQPDRELGTLGTLGWITAGVGGAVLLTALTVDLLVLDSSLQDLRRASAENDTATYDSVKPSVDSQQALVQGLLVSGGVLVAAGATMYVMDLLDAPEPESQGSVRVVPTWQGAAVHMSW